MRRGGATKRVEELERTARDVEQQIASDRAEIVELERAISSALAEQERLIEAQAGGSLSPARAQKDFARLDDAIAGGRRDRDRLSRVIEVREGERTGIERQLEEARFAVACEKYAEAAEAAHEGSATVASLLRKVEPALTDLARLRCAVDSAKARADELRPQGQDLPHPAALDEPAWLAKSGLDQLAEQVAAGPRQPVATSQQRVAQQRKDHERGREQQVEIAVDRALSMPAGGGMREMVFSSLGDPELEATAREMVAAAIAAPRPDPVPLPTRIS